MKYLSSRGGDSAGSFREVVLSGLAADGGLFVPEEYPRFSAEKISSFKNLPYHELAYEVISPYIGDDIPEADLRAILESVYNEKIFDNPQIAPLKKLNEQEYILELFHGPTLAFKDFALQLLGKFFSYFLEKEHKKINILGATSGDTGSAAIAGCVGCPNVNIFILHPHGKVSEVQQRQMTTIIADNVFNIAVRGTFDDCQNIVKELFGNIELKNKFGLTAVNSINWARIVAQIVYYFYAAAQLGAPEKKVSFSVPTGNFGDILAGYIAQRMGLPIEKLIIATNSNDILHRFMKSGIYRMQDVVHTLSPSMDIQISSNFERLLFEYHNRDSARVTTLLDDLKNNREFTVAPEVLGNIRELFTSARVNDEETLQTITQTFEKYGEMLDPHTAIGLRAGQGHPGDIPVVTLATAHPAKFPDAVHKATKKFPELPEHLHDLFERHEKYHILDNDPETIRGFLAEQ